MLGEYILSLTISWAMVFYLYFFQQNYPREKVRKCMQSIYIFLFTYNYWLAVILKLVVLDLPFLCFMHGDSLFLSEWKSVQPGERLVRVNWKAWHSNFFESCSNPCSHLIISTVITKKYNFVPLTERVLYYVTVNVVSVIWLVL